MMDLQPAKLTQGGAQAPSTPKIAPRFNSGALLVNSGATLPHVIASWPKNTRENIIVSLDSFKGSPTICARLWYRNGDDELKPSPKGLTVALHHLPDLANAMRDALATAQRLGLMEGGDQ